MVVSILRLLDALAPLRPVGRVPQRLTLLNFLEVRQGVSMLMLSVLMVKGRHPKLLMDLLPTRRSVTIMRRVPEVAVIRMVRQNIANAAISLCKES